MTVALDPNVLAAVGEGRIAYDGNNVKACFEAIAAQTCDVTDLVLYRQEPGREMYDVVVAEAPQAAVA